MFQAIMILIMLPHLTILQLLTKQFSIIQILDQELSVVITWVYLLMVQSKLTTHHQDKILQIWLMLQMLPTQHKMKHKVWLLLKSLKILLIQLYLLIFRMPLKTKPDGSGIKSKTWLFTCKNNTLTSNKLQNNTRSKLNNH